MLGFVTKLVGERGHAPDESDATDGRDGRLQTRLYECPDCESVYLAEDLSTCGSCHVAVEPVPSERDLGFDAARSR